MSFNSKGRMQEREKIKKAERYLLSANGIGLWIVIVVYVSLIICSCIVLKQNKANKKRRGSGKSK
ncbi:hypothetical protein HZF08_14420 [Paenibacillus sp. CGMCC 1.16610]|uniref:Uncharacterized protein n=1 Tax=Paenibacillus anseongense TaxID=2682845 RepID=A0ABW9UIW3_9BACL|nr:hypothetical protein [Paenibacillus anseongense]MBA2939507.1 hypothetical protein [Paenibacillus sp. CGMCC 1.16610]MVQ39170.1 hypothetical protein [Paenibacillus anseongense]